MGYKIEFYAYLPNIYIYIFSPFRIKVGSGVGAGSGFFHLSWIRFKGKNVRSSSLLVTHLDVRFQLPTYFCPIIIGRKELVSTLYIMHKLQSSTLFL